MDWVVACHRCAELEALEHVRFDADDLARVVRFPDRGTHRRTLGEGDASEHGDRIVIVGGELAIGAQRVEDALHRDGRVSTFEPALRWAKELVAGWKAPAVHCPLVATTAAGRPCRDVAQRRDVQRSPHRDVDRVSSRSRSVWGRAWDRRRRCLVRATGQHQQGERDTRHAELPTSSDANIPEKPGVAFAHV